MQTIFLVIAVLSGECRCERMQHCCIVDITFLSQFVSLQNIGVCLVIYLLNIGYSNEKGFTR